MNQKILEFYKKQDRLIFLSFALSLTICLVVCLIIALSLNSLPQKLPLFYSQPWGEARLISSSQLFLLPSLIILVLLTNLALSWYLHLSQLPLKRTLSLSSLIFALLILISTFRIVHLFI